MLVHSSRHRQRLVAWSVVTATAGIAAFVGWRLTRSCGEELSSAVLVTCVSGDLDEVLADSIKDVSFSVYNSGRETVRVIGLSRG